ncbi:MAG: hypothetical protein D6811_11645, partial [Alphaproteobacteria bacterium]
MSPAVAEVARAGAGEDEAALDAAILKAHARDDRAALARLYARGGQNLLKQGARDHGLFLLTQAYIYALDAG